MKRTYDDFMVTKRWHKNRMDCKWNSLSSLEDRGESFRNSLTHYWMCMGGNSYVSSEQIPTFQNRINIRRIQQKRKQSIRGEKINKTSKKDRQNSKIYELCFLPIRKILILILKITDANIVVIFLDGKTNRN